MHILFITASPTSQLNLQALQNIKDVAISQQFGIDSIDIQPTPNLIFFDANLTEATIELLISQYAPCNWLVYNLNNNIQQSLQYLQTGASGILTTTCTQQALKKILQLNAQKQLYIEKELSQILAFRQLKKMLTPFSLLSAREFNIFCLLAEDYSMQYIADNLLISLKTAFNCQTQIRKKLGLQKQHKIIKFAKKHGLINQ